MTYYKIDPANSDERLARHLEARPGYRVLRKLPEISQIWCRTTPVCDPADRLVICVIDTETSGLDPSRHELIEIAVGRLVIDRHRGDIVDISAPKSWLQEPTQPISEEIEQLTGLTDAIVAGEAFDDLAILREIAAVDVIVAANARFDAGLMLKRYPQLTKPWACSVTEINWQDHGLVGGRSLDALLTAAGLYSESRHRAASDVWSLMNLLMLTASDGRALVAHLVDRAQRLTARLEAIGATYDVKDALKAAGYRWNSQRRVWAKEGEIEAIYNEVPWLKALHSSIRPSLVPIDWHNRHTP
jgi:DNA polymerase III subunit epsilon